MNAQVSGEEEGKRQTNAGLRPLDLEILSAIVLLTVKDSQSAAFNLICWLLLRMIIMMMPTHADADAANRRNIQREGIQGIP